MFNFKKEKSPKVIYEIEYNYDNENRKIWEKFEDGMITEFQYHTLWRDKIVKKYYKNVSDENRKHYPEETNYFYNEQGNLILEIDSFGGRKIYEYDERGNLIKQMSEIPIIE